MVAVPLAGRLENTMRIHDYGKLTVALIEKEEHEYWFSVLKGHPTEKELHPHAVMYARTQHGLINGRKPGNFTEFGMLFDLKERKFMESELFHILMGLDITIYGFDS